MTIRNVITPLRKMLGDAVRQGLLVAKPAARADLPPAPDFTGKEIAPDHADAIRRALLTLAPPDPIRNEPDLVYVCFSTSHSARALGSASSVRCASATSTGPGAFCVLSARTRVRN